MPASPMTRSVPAAVQIPPQRPAPVAGDVQDRLDLVLQATRAAVWDWLPREDVARCDGQIWALLGFEDARPRQVTWAEWLSIVHPDDAPRMDAAMQALLHGDVNRYECEYRVRGASGGWVWLMDRGRVQERDADGRVLRISGVHIDIHAAKSNEENLLETSAHLMEQTRLLQVTLGSISQGIAMVGPDGRISAFNPRACELLDIPDAVMRERPTFHELMRYQLARGDFGPQLEFMEPHARPYVVSMGHSDMPESYLRRTLDGRYLEVRTRQLGAEGLVRTYTDVTGYIEARDALRAEQARSREITESALDAILVASGSGEVAYANPAAQRLFGLDRDATQLGTLPGHLPQGLWQDPTQPDQPRLMWGRRGDGSAFPAEVSVSHGQVGEEKVITVILRDISERLAAEQRVQALNALLERRVEQRTAELERSMRDLETISYSMAHDLRAPLRAMNGYAMLVLAENGERLTPEGRHKLERVVQSARDMGAMIDDLLGLVRVLRTDIEFHSVDMVALARDVVRLLGPMARSTVIDVGELPPAQGDATLLRQLLHNLLDNALKYSDGTPDARVSMGYDDVQAAYWVRDNGPGFDMAYADQLFQVFQRLHNNPGTDGTGIGLSIASRVVERHGGRIWAESSPGQGATFWFTLPSSEGPTHPAGLA